MSKNIFASALLLCLFYALFGLAIALVAGTYNLPYIWTVLVVQAIVGIIGLFKLDPELLKERMHPAGKDKDPLGPLLLTLLFISQFVVAALDVGRWHFSSSVPSCVQSVGLLLCGIGWCGLLWSMLTNKFFSSAIRLQTDRGQKVVSEGPYKWIRHPGYAFAALGFIAQGLALGSWWSILPGAILSAQLLYRTLLEERMLNDNLAGYREYAENVKYKWVPGIW